MAYKILDRNDQGRDDHPMRSNIDPVDQYRKGTVENLRQHELTFYDSLSYREHF